jgi:hypothetical protein
LIARDALCAFSFDGNAAVPLLKPLPPAKKLLADKADDCTAFWDWLARRGTTPVIPNKINLRKPLPYNKRAYRHRNKIERSAASRTRAASLPVTAKAPGTSSAPSA